MPDKTENGSLSVTPKNAKKGSDVTITATPDKGYEVGDIVAKDAKGNKLTLKDNGDGTYTFTMPASKVIVSASFAFIGDVVIAEPKALIGFAGPRVIEQTVREKLPEGFQRSEFLLRTGQIDQIVDRRELRARISVLTQLLMKKQPVNGI